MIIPVTNAIEALRVLSDWGRRGQLLLFFFRIVSSAGHALLFAVGAGRRMMGSGEHGVSMCFTTFEGSAPQGRTLNEIALPIAPTERSGITLAGEAVFLAPPVFVSFHAVAAQTGCLR